VASVEDGPDGKPLLSVTGADDLRQWLAAQQGRTEGVWLVQGRPGSDLPRMRYEEMIAELLCVGWIDASVRTLDEQRSLLWISPRRKGSVWSGPNKQRVAGLQAEGRMLPAGQAVVDRAVADGTWTVLDGPEALEVPDDLAVALDGRPGARAGYDALPPSARKQLLSQIALAKTAATRARRVEAALRAAQQAGGSAGQGEGVSAAG
jgi:uncharacterized protein YdeI (YjbR/CyaY-like superfamily)